MGDYEWSLWRSGIECYFNQHPPDMSMRFYSLILFLIAACFQACTGSKTESQKVFIDDFNWTITIPEGFDSVSASDWKKMQNKGADAIEQTFDEEVVNQTTTLFVFSSDQLNYFESNYQPYDTAVDGNYVESTKAVADVLYETFMAQIPGVKIDSTRSVEKIDNLEFQKLTMKVTYPNDMMMNLYMYSRLFDKREFAVNIMYVDESKGQKMLEAWNASRFGQ